MPNALLLCICDHFIYYGYTVIFLSSGIISWCLHLVLFLAQRDVREIGSFVATSRLVGRPSWSYLYFFALHYTLALYNISLSDSLLMSPSYIFLLIVISIRVIQIYCSLPIHFVIPILPLFVVSNSALVNSISQYLWSLPRSKFLRFLSCSRGLSPPSTPVTFLTFDKILEWIIP